MRATFTKTDTHFIARVMRGWGAYFGVFISPTEIVGHAFGREVFFIRRAA
jgi:hypothetical protein